MKMKVSTIAAVIASASALAGATAHAAPAAKSYGVSLGGGYSDNITRSSVDEQTETMALAGLDFSVAQETARIRALATADLAYISYLDNTYDDEVVGNLNAEALFGLIPERIEWFVQDNFGQVRSDPFSPSTPDNSENINYFTTGPDFTLRLGSLTRVRLSGRYSNVAYEDSPFDNDRFGAGLGLLRDLSSASVVSLNARTEKTEYDNTGLTAVDYQRDEASLGYLLEGSRTQADAELGYSIIDRDTIAEDSKGLLARLTARRQLSTRSALTVRMGRELSDASGAFRSQQNLTLANLEPQSVLQSADIFTSEYAYLRWDFQGRRTGFGVGLSTFDEAYEEQIALDRRRTSVDAYVFRNLTATLRAELRGFVTKEEYDTVDTEFRDTWATAALSWQTTRKLSLRFQVDRLQRSSDGTEGFHENRVWLQLRYGVGLPGDMTLSPVRRSVPIRTTTMPVDAGG